jgi:hypothetical protein
MVLVRDIGRGCARRRIVCGGDGGYGSSAARLRRLGRWSRSCFGPVDDRVELGI